MKKTKLQFIFATILTALFSASIAHADLSDVLDKETLKTRIRDEVAALDLTSKVSLGSVDLFEGVNLSGKYRYEVEASYQDQYYTRMDKWDLKEDINVGDIVENFVDLPFTFSIKNQNSFFFIRQFKTKREAIKALPYTPKRLPLNAEKAMENMVPGDFVSIPANLTVAVEAKATTITTAPVILGLGAKVYWILNGEFTIQVYRIDETHVRLKIIAKSTSDRGVEGSANLSFQFFSVKVVDNQVDRLFDRDLIRAGYATNPGSQFIADYIFDLSDSDSKEAYDQILNSTYKFKNASVLQGFGSSEKIQNNLISTYEKAEKLFELDKNKAPKERRVSRIFKGFNDYTGFTKKLKLGLLVAKYKKDEAFTENKITYMDKEENSHEFFYPTYSKYIEARSGKWIFDLRDQSYQNYFGLIPTINKDEDNKKIQPDYGLTFNRRDKRLRPNEQEQIKKFMLGHIPERFEEKVQLTQWRDNETKTDSKITFELILKSQGFQYLHHYTKQELEDRLIAYAQQKSKFNVTNNKGENPNKFVIVKDVLSFNFNLPINKKDLKRAAHQLYDILSNDTLSPEEWLTRLVKLNDYKVFERMGVGYLISLLPADKLIDLIYLKVDISAKKSETLSYEFGTLNHRTLYKELEEVQSRITTKSYDLRVTEGDYDMEEVNEDNFKK